MGEVGTGIYPPDVLRDVYDVIMESVLLDERLNHPRDATLFLDTLVDLGHVMAKGEPVPHDQDALNAIVGAMCRAACFTGYYEDSDAVDCIGSIERRGYRVMKLSAHETEIAHQDLARAREDLASVRAQDPDRHFKRLRESAEVIQAYDQVREAEKAEAKLERVSS